MLASAVALVVGVGWMPLSCLDAIRSTAEDSETLGIQQSFLPQGKFVTEEAGWWQTCLVAVKTIYESQGQRRQDQG